jgi:arginine/ornithine N-succinyltransferase beta subunit
MMIIRPIAHSDLPGLMNLARSAGVGLTSLPVNEERLSRRISRSVLSFAGELDPPIRVMCSCWKTAKPDRSVSVRWKPPLA